jgi:hypothetical protein
MSELYEDSAFEDQRQYLLTDVRKSRDIQVKAFYHRLLHLNGLMQDLPNPNEEAKPSDQQVKQLFFKGMPIAFLQGYFESAQHEYG